MVLKSHIEPAAAEPDPVDATIIAELRELDDGEGGTIFSELVTLFDESTSKLLSQARHEFENPTRLEIIAHTLKGSCSNFGAYRMEQLCQVLEERCGQKISEGARGLIAAIELEFCRVRKALEICCA